MPCACRTDAISIGRMNTPNLRQRVADELERRRGNMKRISVATGVSYDTLLRIKGLELEVGYSKVQTVHDYLFPAQTEVKAA